MYVHLSVDFPYKCFDVLQVELILNLALMGFVDLHVHLARMNCVVLNLNLTWKCCVNLFDDFVKLMWVSVDLFVK